MELIWAQTLTLGSLFAAMLILFLLPFGVLSRKPEAFQGLKYEITVSLANCMSAGVFLATFFIGLLPEVRHLFHEVLPNINFPVTETVVFAGFYLALFTEQVALACRERSQRKKRQALSEQKIRVVVSPIKKIPPLDLNETTAPTKVLEGRVVTSCSSGSSSCQEDDYEEKMPSKVEHHGHSHGGDHHGHSHAAEWSEFASSKESGVRLFILLLALGVHSIFEGLALGLQRNVQTLFSLFVGVALHESLVAFALGVNVARSKLSKKATIRLALIFAASIPFGQVIGYLVAMSGGESSGGRTANAILQGLAAGTFIHVTFLEVIPSEFHNDVSSSTPNRFLKLVFLLLGFMLLLGCTVILQSTMAPHHH